MTLEPPEFIPTKSYTFGKLRELFSMLPISQGVVQPTDFQVLQREAGANLSVDVLPGDVWVKGESTARQGLYHTNNTSRTNVVMAEGSGANPRVDQVIVVINDSSITGSSDIPEFKIIEGTPSAGTQISSPEAAKYRLGAKTDAEIRALFPNFVRLADVLVEKSTKEIKTGNIVDRRPLSGDTNLPFVVKTGNIAATSGEYIIVEPTHGIVTLPTVGYNSIVGIWNFSDGVVTVKATGGAKIYGDFINNQESITLGVMQHAVLQGTGFVWFITSGKPMVEAKFSLTQGRSKGLMESGIEFSPTRPVELFLVKSLSAVEIGGVKLGGSGTLAAGMFVRIPAGQVIKSTSEAEYNILIL